MSAGVSARQPGAALQEELDSQLETLLRAGYPALLGTTPEVLAQRVARLARRLPEATAGASGTQIPFVLVVPGVAADRAVTLVELRGKPGFTSMEPDDLARFAPVAGVELPSADAYLATGLDTGRDTLNVPPGDALPTIAAHGRSPLTIAEGIALVTHHPDVLRTRNCFSLAGSRCGDRRVPALWISKGAPRLGWCWAGAPHAWLGTASCSGRLG